MIKVLDVFVICWIVGLLDEEMMNEHETRNSEGLYKDLEQRDRK